MNKSIYKYAAEAGVPVGIYLTLMSACLLMSIKLPALPSLLLPLALGFPFLLAVVMRRIAKLSPEYHKVSALWLGGIYSVIFGTLICMLFSAAYIIFVEPAFVHEYVSNAVATIEESPQAGSYASTLSMMHEAIDAGILPSGMEFVATMGWSTCFFGSVLSLPIAMIIAGRRRKKVYG